MPRSQLSRTTLSKQAGVLRTSLLLSLGLSPLACGGTAVSSGSQGGGGSTQQTTAGTREYGLAGTATVAENGGAIGEYLAGAPGFSGSFNQGGTGWTVAGAPPQAGAYGAGAGGVSAGAGGVSAGAGGVSAGTAGVIDPDACPNPVFSSSSKLTVCGNGRQHRPMSIACTFNTPPAGGNGGAPGSGGSGGSTAAAGSSGTTTYMSCQTDADCSALPLGFCSREGNAPPVCKPGCVSDADCGSGVCACDGVHPGQCVTANCITDADCGPNSLCAIAYGICGGSSFQCTSPQDTCATSNDCNGRGCAMIGDHRACNGAVCGRPFLVSETARMAALETRADWLDEALTPDPSALTPLERAQLAAHWARLGQMEHASIAAFARFNLQLLSLGAPCGLVEACNRALSDETAHARTCFAFASAYGGSAIGPARLDIEHCFEDTSLAAVAKLVLREGCLGETVAALEALAAAEVARDRAVKQALTRIARDELQHAQLAFQFVRWAVSMSSIEERRELAREVAQLLADFESEAAREESTRTDDRLAGHGLLGGDALRTIHLAAVREVSRPLLAALFEPVEGQEARAVWEMTIES